MPTTVSSPIPSLGYESTTHRVLSIPELLQTIFSFGTRASNASNALVCRSWREPALDHFWHEVDDIYYLLQILSPFRQEGTSFHVRLLM
jgi:F-box-like